MFLTVVYGISLITIFFHRAVNLLLFLVHVGRLNASLRVDRELGRLSVSYTNLPPVNNPNYNYYRNRIRMVIIFIRMDVEISLRKIMNVLFS